MTTIFITGTSGYIGGTVLPYIINAFRLNNVDINVRALMRTAEKDEKLLKWAKQRGLGNITPVRGSLASKDVLIKEVANADIIIDTADCDDLEGGKSIIEGLKVAIGKGKHPVIVHTSGTNLLTDGTKGLRGTDRILHDDKEQELNSIPDEAPHRNVDLLYLSFFKAHPKDLEMVIIAPPTIWGLGRGPDNIISQQVPQLVKIALREKQAYHAGKGLNIWTQIHVVDLANFYATITLVLLSEPGKHCGFYFCEGGEFAWKDVTKAIQTGLVECGFTTETNPKDAMHGEAYEEVFTKHDDFDYDNIVGGNARVRAVKARALGWRPLRSTAENFFNDITDLVTLIARKYQLGNSTL